MLASILLTAQLAGATPCPPPTISERSAVEWSRNIAVVSGPKGKGFGMVVGWAPGLVGRAPGEAWIAVPAHVVFGTVPPTDNMAPYRAGLDIRLFGDDTKRPLCETAEGGNGNPRPPKYPIDLTFVCVDWDGMPLFNSALPAREVRAGDPLQLLRRDVRMAKASGTVVSTGGANSDLQVTLAGFESESGLPVASPAGVVGLYLGLGEASGGRVLSMQTMVSRAATIPWQLVENEYFDCNRLRQVCVGVERGVVPTAVTLRSLFRPGSANVTPGRCVDLPEGKYQIATGGGIACEPRYVAVHAEGAALSLKLECQAALGGKWLTPKGDWLICLDESNGRAACTGLSALGGGLLKATFSANGARVSVTGSFESPTGATRPASGNLVWNAGRLTGEIRRGQDLPWVVDLKKEDAP